MTLDTLTSDFRHLLKIKKEILRWKTIFLSYQGTKCCNFQIVQVNKSRNRKFLLAIKTYNALLVTKSAVFSKISYFESLTIVIE